MRATREGSIREHSVRDSPVHKRSVHAGTDGARAFSARVVLAGMLLSGLQAHAAEPSTKFVMTAYTNGPGGAKLVEGRFDEALKETRHPMPGEASMIMTNRCVAYTMTGQFAAARALCDTAIREARSELQHPLPGDLRERSNLGEYLAIAYSNRAVLHWLSSDAVAAALDLADAASVSPKAEFVARNISALRSPHEGIHGDAVTQIAATPKS